MGMTVSFNPNSIDFGVVPPGAGVTPSTVSTQCGTLSAPVNVTASITNDASGGAFTVSAVTSFALEDTHLGGFVEVQKGESNGVKPLAVASGQYVVVTIEFKPTASTSNVCSATLLIQGDTWNPVSIPITAIVSEINVSVPAIVVGQGQSVELNVTVALATGPATEVSLTLDGSLSNLSPAGILSLNQNLAQISEGAPATVELTATADATMAVGSYTFYLAVSAYGGRYNTVIPIVVDVVRSVVTTWTPVSGGLRRISVGSQVNVWGLNLSNEIFRYTGNDAKPWALVPGPLLSEIGVAGDGTVWGVNAANEIFNYTGNGANPWAQVPGALCRISVGSRANVWGVNAANEIFSYTGNDAKPWAQVPGPRLSDIGVAADSTVWGVNAANEVFRYTGKGANPWAQVPGALCRISMGSRANVWGVNAANEIFQSTRFDLVSWAQVSGELSEVGVGADGTVWGVNRANEIFRADRVPAGYATPPAFLGGNSQYIYVGNGPLMDLMVEIKVTEAIQVSPTSGVTSTEPSPLPIGFQINGFSPIKDDNTVGWQQYGVRMWKGINTLNSFAESWPTAYETNRKLPNLFQISSKHYDGSFVTLPNDLTIPAGWTIRFQFQQQSDGTIMGFACKLTDGEGHIVGPPAGLGINLLNKVPLAAGGFVGQGDLATMVAFQVVLVGFWSDAQAVLISGAGTITCTSSTPMTPMNSWPYPSPGNSAKHPFDASGKFGTAENTNSGYGLVPAQPSTSITQPFSTYR